MKKIKYLLSFFVVGVGLFINQSFGQCIDGGTVQYSDSNNNGIIFDTSACGMGNYLSGNLPVSSTEILYNNSDSLLFSDYSIETGFTHGHSISVDTNFNQSVYLSSGSITINGRRKSSTYYMFKPTIGSNISNDLTFSTSWYNSHGYSLNINGDSSCINTGVLLNGNCSFNWYLYHDDILPYGITNYGVVHDTRFNGVDYIGGPVSYTLGRQYSIAFTNVSDLYNSGLSFDDENSFINFRTVIFDSAGVSHFYDGIYFVRLYEDTLLNINSSSFKIMSIYGTGDEENPYLLFGLYNCPSTAQSVYDCYYLTGGYLLTGINNSFATNDSGSFWVWQNTDGTYYNSFPRWISNTRYYSRFFYVFYNSLTNQVSFTFLSYGTESSFGSNGTFSFTLSPNKNIGDILTGINPPNIFPTYSGNISIGYDCVDTEVCYNTTGDDGLVYRLCTSKCLDSGTIASGSYVGSDGTIYYVDSNYDLSQLSAGDIIFDTGFLDEDGFVSLDYYMTLFDSPSNFALGKCPYPPSTFLEFATEFKIGKIYPLMPLNCLASAFNQGFRIHYFDDFGLFPDLNSQLISGDTHFHKTLYRFFDVLLSLGLFVAISALFRIFKK